jgi:hypothetical protein
VVIWTGDGVPQVGSSGQHRGAENGSGPLATDRSPLDQDVRHECTRVLLAKAVPSAVEASFPDRPCADIETRSPCSLR